MHDVSLPGVDWLLSFWLVALLFTGFAMGGVANAINIIDGFNGLAAGSLLIMLAAFAWVAHQVGDDLVFALAILYGGLVLGFFLVNFPLGKTRSAPPEAKTPTRHSPASFWSELMPDCTVTSLWPLRGSRKA
jgi:hypothetical protein